MRGVLPAVLGVLVAASPAPGQDTAARTAPATAASPVPGPPQRLNLGPYRSVYADDPAALADQLRYQEQVEVRGKAMDARSLTLKLEWWMRDIELDRGATPASMSAPSIAEMRDYRPHPPDSINLVPVMQWLSEKLGGKKK
jgi:hypothetical protein